MTEPNYLPLVKDVMPSDVNDLLSSLLKKARDVELLKKVFLLLGMAIVAAGLNPISLLTEAKVVGAGERKGKKKKSKQSKAKTAATEAKLKAAASSTPTPTPQPAATTAAKKQKLSAAEKAAKKLKEVRKAKRSMKKKDAFGFDTMDVAFVDDEVEMDSSLLYDELQAEEDELLYDLADTLKSIREEVDEEGEDDGSEEFDEYYDEEEND